MLRRLFVLSALVLTAFAVPLTVTASDGSIDGAFVQTLSDAGIAVASPTSGADVAVGRGTSCRFAVCTSPRDFLFAGASSLNGGVAGGIYSQTLTLCQAPEDCQSGTFRAHVVCVTADANVATIGAVVFQSDFTLPGVIVKEGDEVVVTAYDNGRSGDPTPDALSFIYGETPLVVDGQCLNAHKPPMFTVFDGDVMVRDGQLVGTSG